MRGDGALLCVCRRCCVVGGGRAVAVGGRKCGEGEGEGGAKRERTRRRGNKTGNKNDGNGLGLTWTTTKRHEWRDRSFSRKNTRKRGKGQ